MPVTQLLGGIGIVLNDADQTPLAIIDQFARYGFRHARIEVPWSRLQFDHESQIDGADRLASLLTSCRAKGIRPLILLNSHHGLPTPAIQFSGVVQSDASAGARSVHLDTPGKIVPGFTGLSNLTSFWAAEVLITEADGPQLTLSKPLPRALQRGERVQLATLKYQPFSTHDAGHGEETLAGWVHYVDVVSKFAVAALGSADSPDKGFDLEIWNELSMGAMFLSINNYYDPPVSGEPAYRIWDEIVGRTSDWIIANKSRFGGVRICNGFASTVPWPASSIQPPAVSAISKHPYPPSVQFPKDNQSNTQTLNSNGRPTTWVPTYKAYFPEYFATGIQTETIVRDMGPTTSDIYGVEHGRLARTDGAGPVPVWITEIGVNPIEAGVADPTAGDLLKAKATARTLLFYLNKGCERIYLYCASGTPDGYGLANYEATGNLGHSLALDIIQRITKVMTVDNNFEPRDNLALTFVVHAPRTSELQFTGNGSASNPSFSNIDMLALLPFHAGGRRVIIACYFVTRDLRTAIKPEPVGIEIAGLAWRETTISIYDPFSDNWQSVPGKSLPNKSIVVSMLVTDSPRLLVLDRGTRSKPSGDREKTHVGLGSGNPLEAVKWT